MLATSGDGLPNRNPNRPQPLLSSPGRHCRTTLYLHTNNMRPPASVGLPRSRCQVAVAGIMFGSQAASFRLHNSGPSGVGLPDWKR